MDLVVFPGRCPVGTPEPDYLRAKACQGPDHDQYDQRVQEFAEQAQQDQFFFSLFVRGNGGMIFRGVVTLRV
jgi:hypothetical protein